MEAVRRFIEEFIATEHAAQLSLHTERDDEVLAAEITAVNTFFSAGMTTELYRPPKPPEFRFKRWAKQVPQLAPRKLFLIRRYQSDK